MALVKQIPTLNKQDLERFESFVDRSGDCHIWVGNTKESNYGKMWIGEKIYLASRIAWAIEHGSTPTNMCVLHKCDNPRCVKAEHLFLGTKRQNTEDMVRKGRHGSQTHPETITRGENRPSSKLVDDQVLKIRALYSTCDSNKSFLGRMFKVHPSVVRSIVTRETWRHLP